VYLLSSGFGGLKRFFVREGVKKMIKRILLSLLIITAVGASAVGATKALLSDSVTLTANTFSTGTVDLKIATGKNGGTFQDTQVGFTETDIFPGQTRTNFFRLRNVGSGSPDLLIIAQAANVSGGIAASDVTITITPVNSSDVPVGSAVSHTLDSWLSTPDSLSPPNISANTTQRYKMNVTISSSVTTASASSIFDFVFTGTQVP